MGVKKTQKHSVFALKEAYETILMAPAETSRDQDSTHEFVLYIE